MNLFSEKDCDTIGSKWVAFRQENTMRLGVSAISIDKANKLFNDFLAKGKVVETCLGSSGEIWFDKSAYPNPIGTETHRAIIVNIEPIVPDSTEKLLKEMTTHQSINFEAWNEFMVRAKVLLAKEKP